MFIHGEQPNKMKREMALMKRVAHEHVCKYYEHHVSAEKSLFGIVMEVLESGSLARASRRVRTADPQSSKSSRSPSTSCRR